MTALLPNFDRRPNTGIKGEMPPRAEMSAGHTGREKLI
jgi:hypothetical protein